MSADLTRIPHALDSARAMAAAGIPVFVVHPDASSTTGYGLPKKWQNHTANPAYVDVWRPGLGLCAVMGRGLDLVDLDPRNGADMALLTEVLPTVYAKASTPSGGWHYFVKSMGVRSRDNVAPGIDVKAGDADGQGRGFAFIAPTVRASKVTGELAPYVWSSLPDLERLKAAADDHSGDRLAEMVRAAHGSQRPAGGQQDSVWDLFSTGPWSDIAGTLKAGRHAGVVRLASALRGRGGWRVGDAITLMQVKVWPLIDQNQGGHPYTETEFEADITDVFSRYDDGPSTSVATGNESAGEEVAGSPAADQPPPPPAVDQRMFTGLLGEIVRAADPTTEADPVGVLVSLLAGVGVLIGPDPYVQVGNTRHPLLVWPLLFGRTGSGRKGEAAATADLFLRTAEPVDHPAVSVSGLSSGEGLIERVRDLNPQAGKGNSGGVTDKRLLVVEPEFSAVMARAKREGSTLAAVLRQAWDGKALSVLNRAALVASSSHIGIVGHVTPREFRMRLAETEMSGGTYNRFLPVYVERSKKLPIPDGLGKSVLDPLADRLGRAIADACEITRVTLGPDAAKVWTSELYDDLTESDDEDTACAEFARRAAPYCLRIAALYAVLDNCWEIGPGHLDAAAALVRYSGDSAKYVLDRQLRDPRLDRIRRAIDGSEQGLTRTEISGLFSRNLPKATLDELLDSLLSLDEYQVREEPTGGRPVSRYVRVRRHELRRKK